MTTQKLFICPMHPEIQQEQPGRCPLCHMRLVEKHSAMHTMPHHRAMESNQTSWKSYLPLIVIICLILLVTGTLTYKDILQNTVSAAKTISYFMIGFFITFAGFKLMDIKGFAEGYTTYDLLAKRLFLYGYIYPFLELFFGLSMIFFPKSRWLLSAEFFVMVFSGLGVAIKLVRKEKFQCACLGTFLKVPLTKVTIIEDFGMAALAGVMLLIH